MTTTRPYVVGDRVRYIGTLSRRPVGSVGTVTSVTDGDPTVTWDDGSQASIYPLLENIELVTPQATITPGDRIPGNWNEEVELELAWKIGNEIEFTVPANDAGDRYRVGCKRPIKEELGPFLTYSEKVDPGRPDSTLVNLTLRGTIEQWEEDDGFDTYTREGIRGAGSVIDLGELSEFVETVRVISRPSPVDPIRPPAPQADEVAVTLTRRQAQAIAALSGCVGGQPEGWRGAAQEGLERIGEIVGLTGTFGYQDSPAYSYLSGGVRFSDDTDNNPF